MAESKTVDQTELIRKLVKRIEALEATRIFLETDRPIPEVVINDLLDTAGVLQEARVSDWVKNVGI